MELINESEIDYWFTTENGIHIPVRRGETKEEALNNKFKEDERKKAQLEIIKENNPLVDEYHTGIRDITDIKTPIEAFKTKINDDEDYLYPDFSKEDGEKALKDKQITIYSSKEIKQGTFVSPSKMMARDYAGTGQIYEKLVNINDVAWIDSNEGQYTQLNKSDDKSGDNIW